ncbi:GNAT family N-acetyltransferase [Sphingobacterium lactis]|uniref:Phosphinothricin acetyltransferase n=1 Tax=Sphingobacterium lactis TaxID=797291 RepID=A0A1H5XRK9_9SPHI|nr:GNAT family N-acetyltransferase [Sphingobacterium lactis]SEG14364.1 phosphinothricin acetyltransferase [Sphingobacterium lactis]
MEKEFLQFRDATEADLPTIVAIYNSTVSSRMVTADTAPVTVESRMNWFREHSADRRPLWIVEQDGHTLGWVSFQSFYGRPAYDATVEVSIYLNPEQRGRGLGKAVLAHALASAPTFGVKTMLGFIFAHNEPSIRLFQGFGFEEWANLPNIAEMDGQEYGLKILGKRLV